MLFRLYSPISSPLGVAGTTVEILELSGGEVSKLGSEAISNKISNKENFGEKERKKDRKDRKRGFLQDEKKLG
jgi:hypothetical protein